MPAHPTPKPHHVPTDAEEPHERKGLPIDPDDGAPEPAVPHPDEEGHVPEIPA